MFQVAFELSHDRVARLQSAETVARDGLGFRYAFRSTWMIAKLSAIGFADHHERYVEGNYDVGKVCEPSS